LCPPKSRDFRTPTCGSGHMAARLRGQGCPQGCTWSARRMRPGGRRERRQGCGQPTRAQPSDLMGDPTALLRSPRGVWGMAPSLPPASANLTIADSFAWVFGPLKANGRRGGSASARSPRPRISRTARPADREGAPKCLASSEENSRSSPEAAGPIG